MSEIRAYSHGIDGSWRQTSLAEAERAARVEIEELRPGGGNGVQGEIDDQWPDASEIEKIGWSLVVDVATEVDREPATCDRCGAEAPDGDSCSEAFDEHDWPEHDYTCDYQLRESPTLAEDLVEVLRTRPAVWLEVQRLMAPQPAPQGGEGDCWVELLEYVGPSHSAAAMGAERREFGLAKYKGQPVRRGDGRDETRDLVDELLDGAVYAWRLRYVALAVHLLDVAADPAAAEQRLAARAGGVTP